MKSPKIPSYIPAPPVMKIDANEFLAETSDLSCQEAGAYSLILIAMWNRQGYLPNDDKVLQRVARCNRRQWSRIKRSVQEKLVVTEDGRIFCPRLLNERIQQASNAGVLNRISKNGLDG